MVPWDTYSAFPMRQPVLLAVQFGTSYEKKKELTFRTTVCGRVLALVGEYARELFVKDAYLVAEPPMSTEKSSGDKETASKLSTNKPAAMTGEKFDFGKEVKEADQPQGILKQRRANKSSD